MPNIGWQELAVIFVLALIFIGPKRLPSVARQAGKAMRELKKASSDFREQVRDGLGMDENEATGFPYAQPKAGAAIPAATPDTPSMGAALNDAPWGPEPEPPAADPPGPLGDAPWSESA